MTFFFDLSLGEPDPELELDAPGLLHPVFFSNSLSGVDVPLLLGLAGLEPV